jgi:hypothetical protein
MFEGFKAWYDGKLVENDPQSSLVILGGRYERSASARALRTAVEFYLKHWQWCVAASLLANALARNFQKIVQLDDCELGEPRRRMRNRLWLLLLAFSTVPSLADESWSCTTVSDVKPPFVVGLRLHGTKLYATPGDDVATVISDTPRHVLAYWMHWNESLKPRVPVFLYYWIDRQTGEFLHWNDIGIAPIYEKAIPEVSLSSGTCTKQ